MKIAKTTTNILGAICAIGTISALSLKNTQPNLAIIIGGASAVLFFSIKYYFTPKEKALLKAMQSIKEASPKAR